MSTATTKMPTQVKLVIVGDGAVGKTCMLTAYSQNAFPTKYVPTVFDTYVVNVQVNRSQIVELSLWDTAGQEEYDRLRPLSYASASVFILCFAMCNRASYLNVASKWHPELKHFCPLTPIVLVGSRADEVTDELHLAHMRKQGHTPVTTAEGLEMAKRIGATEYLEVSAKTGANLKEAFDTAIRTTLMPPKKHHHCMLL